MQTAFEGETIICRQKFNGEGGQPEPLKTGYPRARLYLGSDLLGDVHVEQDEKGWFALVTIPELDLGEPTALSLKWRARGLGGGSHKITEVILVQPSTAPDSGDLVVMGDEDYNFILPVSLSESSNLSMSVFMNNDTIIPNTVIPHTDRVQRANYTEIKFGNHPAINPWLESFLVVFDFANTSVPRNQRMMLNLWVVTPQMLNCMNALEATLNKAKLDNVIPQLEYTQSDLLHYLQRGLNLFNGYAPNLTGFTGTNMQGALFDGLILCASYYALAAQLLAEGMLAFDFSGQAVTLSVDRTPHLESALGRVEQQIQERIPKLKQMLLRRGVSDGSGHDPVGSSAGLGITVLSNSPTTNKAVFRPGYAQYYHR